jgi:Flp pilus assembly protein TadD
MSRMPKPVPGCDIRSLPLTPAEAFLLSRVDATADEQELALCTGFPAEQVAAMLDRLAGLGAIAVAGGSVTQTRVRATEALPDDDGANRRSGPRPVDPRPAPTPTPDETAALRRKMLARKLSATTPITPPVRTVADPANVLSTFEAVNAQRDRAAEAARLDQLERSLEQGKGALAREDFAGAIDAYRMASSLAPHDPEVQTLCDDAIRSAAGALAEGHWREAIAAESDGRWEDALLGYSRVCAGRPGDPLPHERVAIAALRVDNVRRAVEFARKAVELAPGTARFRVTLARAYAAAGFEASSHGQLDRALELAPDDARVRSVVSRVRSLPRSAGRTG